jgi:hypothetical protein
MPLRNSGADGHGAGQSLPLAGLCQAVFGISQVTGIGKFQAEKFVNSLNRETRRGISMPRRLLSFPRSNKRAQTLLAEMIRASGPLKFQIVRLKLFR